MDRRSAIELSPEMAGHEPRQRSDEYSTSMYYSYGGLVDEK